MDDGGFARRETAWSGNQFACPCGDGRPEECLEHSQEAADIEPDVDDSVKYCPDCERPNQFGELCRDCQNEQAFEVAEFGLRWDGRC